MLFCKSFGGVKPIPVSYRSHNDFLGLRNKIRQILIDPSALPEHPRTIHESLENATPLPNPSKGSAEEHSIRRPCRLETIDFEIKLRPITKMPVENNLPRTRWFRPHRGNKNHADIFHFVVVNQPALCRRQLRRQAGLLAECVGDVFSEFCASWLVKGFENAAPAWLVQAQPRFSPFVPFREFRGSTLLSIVRCIAQGSPVQRPFAIRDHSRLRLASFSISPTKIPCNRSGSSTSSCNARLPTDNL